MKHDVLRWFFICFLLLAFALRVGGVEKDPPSIALLRDEAPWTDEGTIASPVLHVVRDGAACSSLAFVGGRSLHQMLLCGIFKILGVGRFQGRVLSVLMGMLGLSALARLGGKIWSPDGVWLTLLLAGTGFFHVMYDHLLLTEGVLVALLSILALLALEARTVRVGVLVGTCLGLLTVGFKFHAMVLLPPLAIFYLLRQRNLLIPFLASFGFVFIIWRAVLMPNASPVAVVYVPSRVIDEDLGITTPFAAFVQIVMAGLPVYFFLYQLPLLLFAVIEEVALLLSPRRWLQNASAPVLVAAVWLPTALVGASLFKYLPARYFHFVSPPLILLSVAGMRRLWKGWAFVESVRPVRWGISFVVGLWLLFQVAPPLPIFGKWASWVPLLGLPMPFGVYWLTSRTRTGWRISDRSRRNLVVVLLALQILVQSGLYYTGVVRCRADLSKIAVEWFDAGLICPKSLWN
jgi:hypothetical protein